MDGDGSASRVPQAQRLLGYVDAVLHRDATPASRAAAAAELEAALGPAALVDAAATVASFNAVVRIADGAGIPLEETKAQATADLRAELDIDRLRP